jgi:Type VI secretion system effector, Hcp
MDAQMDSQARRATGHAANRCDVSCRTSSRLRIMVAPQQAAQKSVARDEHRNAGKTQGTATATHVERPRTNDTQQARKADPIRVRDPDLRPIHADSLASSGFTGRHAPRTRVFFCDRSDYSPSEQHEVPVSIVMPHRIQREGCLMSKKDESEKKAKQPKLESGGGEATQDTELSDEQLESVAGGASDIFAKIGDIKGESMDDKHKEEIEILSFSLGALTTTSPTLKR